MITITAAPAPQADVTALTLLAWRDYLLARLREAEARAADPMRSDPERDAATWSARYFASAIESAERRLQEAVDG